MSTNWVQDIKDMGKKFRSGKKVNSMDSQTLRKLLEFRVSMMEEEMSELHEAILNSDSEGVVDAILDLCVFSVETLDIFEIDSEKAWDSIYEANIEKEPGIKRSRPNPFGFSDLIKPEGWKPPSHEGNHGLFEKAFKGEK